jgi:hypothetical protein
MNVRSWRLAFVVVTTLSWGCPAFADVEYPPPIRHCIVNAQQWAVGAQHRGVKPDAVDDGLQQRIAACIARGSITKAQSTCVGLINTDYVLLAQALVANKLSPVEYVGRVRDRTRKMDQCLKNRAWARGIMQKDRDGDLVPDSKDRCPDTKPLAPTDSEGCQVEVQSTANAPSMEEVKVVLDHLNFVADPHCAGAPPPSVPNPIDFTYALLTHAPSSLEIKFGRVVNQPNQCPVLYEVLVHGEQGDEPNIESATMRFVFRAQDEITPPEPNFLSIRKEFSGGGPISAPALRWKIRSMNGNGMASPWSEYRDGKFFIE